MHALNNAVTAIQNNLVDHSGVFQGARDAAAKSLKYLPTVASLMKLVVMDQELSHDFRFDKYYDDDQDYNYGMHQVTPVLDSDTYSQKIRPALLEKVSQLFEGSQLSDEEKAKVKAFITTKNYEEFENLKPFISTLSNYNDICLLKGLIDQIIPQALKMHYSSYCGYELSKATLIAFPHDHLIEKYSTYRSDYVTMVLTMFAHIRQQNGPEAIRSQPTA